MIGDIQSQNSASKNRSKLLKTSIKTSDDRLDTKIKSVLKNCIIPAQARRHGGAFRGRAPQMTACAPPKRKLLPPKRELSPKEINRLWAIGVQIEA